ncbi:MAG: autotransporter domain-containing protein, partial [Pseudomonadota bacterium]
MAFNPRPERTRDRLLFIFCALAALAILAVLLTAAGASFVKFWPYNLDLWLGHYDFDNKDGNLRSSAYTAALYTMIQPDDRLEFSLLAAYSRLNYRGARTINYTVDYTFLGSPRTDSPRDTLTSRTHANQVELSGSTFYNLGSGAWTVGPAAQVSWTR